MTSAAREDEEKSRAEEEDDEVDGDVPHVSAERVAALVSQGVREDAQLLRIVSSLASMSVMCNQVKRERQAAREALTQTVARLRPTLDTRKEFILLSRQLALAKSAAQVERDLERQLQHAGEKKKEEEQVEEEEEDSSPPHALQGLLSFLFAVPQGSTLETAEQVRVWRHAVDQRARVVAQCVELEEEAAPVLEWLQQFPLPSRKTPMQRVDREEEVAATAEDEATASSST